MTPRLAGLALALCLSLCLSLGLAGCGYSTRFGLAEDYPSLGIELFGNDSLEPDIERELHAALVRNARDLVDVSVVAPGAARLVLRGKVRDYRRRSGIRSKENVQLETGLTIRADAELYDPRSDRVVAGPVTASAQVGYTLDRRAVNESEARARALENLAQRLVLELVSRVQVPQPDEGD